MSATARHHRPRALKSVNGARAFQITVNPGKNDTFGLLLEDSFGVNGHQLRALITTATPTQTGRVADAVFAAIRGSGHTPSVLAFNRQTPIPLDEPEGVRLALILLTTQPIMKHARVRALVAGVNAMSTEETYYWYSKCIGFEASRARRALRILLADD